MEQNRAAWTCCLGCPSEWPSAAAAVLSLLLHPWGEGASGGGALPASRVFPFPCAHVLADKLVPWLPGCFAPLTSHPGTLLVPLLTSATVAICVCHKVRTPKRCVCVRGQLGRVLGCAAIDCLLTRGFRVDAVVHCPRPVAALALLWRFIGVGDASLLRPPGGTAWLGSIIGGAAKWSNSSMSLPPGGTARPCCCPADQPCAAAAAACRSGPPLLLLPWLFSPLLLPPWVTT